MHKVEPHLFYQSLPKKRMASGVMMLDGDGNILLVKPGYKPQWEVPGGNIDLDEAPHVAAKREVKEEIGLDVRIKRLLCVDYRLAGPAPETESLQFMFAVDEWQGDILIDGKEIIDYGFFALEKAQLLLTPTLARRLAFSYEADKTGQTFYLQNGLNPFDYGAL